MFISTRKSIVDLIYNIIDAHMVSHRQIYHDKAKQPKQYICETCGCFIAPEFAIPGKKEIRTRERMAAKNISYGLEIGLVKEDYIYSPYYCKVHAPKTDK